MIIYNVTVKIEKDLAYAWLDWMKSTHIPDVLNTGCFINYRILKVLVEEEDGETYTIQYKANHMEDILKYQDKFAAELQKEHTERFKDKFVAFRTLLEELE
jgi:hypothetical protein